MKSLYAFMQCLITYTLQVGFGPSTAKIRLSRLVNNFLNPLPHGVLASFCLTAGGLLRPPEEDDISREKTILMT
jgi:hypothetical protein